MKTARVVILLCGLSCHARAQVIPERTYYGRYRPIPVTVRVPADAKGDAEIVLFDARQGQPQERAAVVPGPVNLAAIFPHLWRETAEPQASPPELVYAQLVVGEQKLGPAVVLQPLLDPGYAPLIEPDGQPKYRPSKGVYSGLRLYIDRHVIVETTLGDITLAMRPDAAPNSVWNFLHLCGGGFYTDVVVHRVKPLHPNGFPFVIQAGDPLQKRDSTPGGGEGGPGYTINLEPSALAHDFGVVAMARNNLPNSAGSQFYIALSRKGTEHLDGKYTTFAQVVGGADVVLKIAASELAPGSDKPKDPPVIKRCRLVDAPPRGEGPKPAERPADKPVER